MPCPDSTAPLTSGMPPDTPAPSPSSKDDDRSEAFYRALLTHMQDAVVLAHHGRLTFVNDAMATMLGYTSADDLVDCPFEDIIAPEDRIRVVATHQQRMAGQDAPEHYALLLLGADGKTRIPAAVSIGTVRMGDGSLAAIGTIKDMSTEDRLHRKLAESEHELRMILHNMPDIFYRTNADGIITMINPAIKDLGYEPNDLVGRPMADLYAAPAQRDNLLKVIRDAGSSGTRVEVEIRHREGHSVWVETRAFVRLAPDGSFLGTEGIARDITERRALEARLRHLAGHDPLTNLPNRSMMREHLDLALSRAKRRNESIGLLFIDLDDFKPINDRHGHTVGDMVLQTIAERLRSCVRDTDSVARLGGDEFTVIVEDDAGIERVLAVADRIIADFSKPVPTDNGEHLRISASIGAALFPDHALTADALLSAADTAMYAAKRSGRNQITIWSAAMNAIAAGVP